MDYEQQRRKRKRIAPKPLYDLYFSLSPPHYYFGVRSLVLCFTFITFLYLLSNRIPIVHSAFRPLLLVPSFPLLSSSSSTNSLIRFHPNNNIISSFPFKIDDRILFPDHVLLMVSHGDVNRNEFVCVYYENPLINSSSSISVSRDLLWVDEYSDFQSIVRCPLPPENFSSVVDLGIRGKSVKNLGDYGEKLGNNRTVHSWETVAYASVLDGNSAVVFVKGLNLRPDRESDPTQFTCHFGLGNLERQGRRYYVLTTKAITAAQEVVRCSLPRSIRMNPSKARGIRVTVGLTPHDHVRTQNHVLLPSVARVFGLKSEKQKKSEGKYELCACTVVWNQASALREWIMYHAVLGIEKWFIYDNNSEDGIKEVVEELELEGYSVSRHVWPWIKSQEAGFSHCALRSRDECKWVGFMDVDEFFYFPFPNPSNHKSGELGFPLQNSLQTLIANFSKPPKIAEIRTACHSFGPSGLSSTPSQGVMAGYTCRLQRPERHKSIVRPDALDITLLNAVHHFHLRKGYEYLNLPQSMAVVNHYKYQVWESFRAKFFRRVATYVADWGENQNEGSRDRAPGLGTEAVEPPNWRLQFCEVWDTGLRDFVLANLADSVTGLLPWERTSL